MEISENLLRELVERVMELTLELSGQSAKKKSVLVVLAGEDAARFLETLRALNAGGECEITTALSRDQINDETIGNMVCSESRKIVEMRQVLKQPLPYDRIIFPVMPREILAKCALCIPDTDEVRIVQRALEEHVPVSVAKNGLDPFTGNEPEPYQKQVLEYVRRLLEYGIDIQMDEKER
ncbi:hypothetical protein ACTQ56_02575 [[Clostridium] aminophilum]|uniref:hypothetical protein n=1 Tax=[Clostridium] aminophilum TaxID=1526 RepID=UPI0026E985B3|nr:hypothetical protein [[Clostridium] aminophilum]MDD6195530.1 hypothetical protein [[Clostridium] aminophilum]